MKEEYRIALLVVLFLTFVVGIVMWLTNIFTTVDKIHNECNTSKAIIMHRKGSFMVPDTIEIVKASNGYWYGQTNLTIQK